MNDKKQIQEMARDLEQCLRYEIEDSSVDAFDTAFNMVHKFNYRKIKDSVVLTREEYEKLQTDTRRLFYQNCNLTIENRNLKENLDIEVLKGKETVEKILKLLDNMYVKEDDRHYWREHNNDCIDKCKAKIAKQFGVEIKE